MIKSIWIEIRPILRCCHVCVVLKSSIDSTVQFKIKKSSMILENKNESLEIKFPDFVVDPLTITNFKSTAQLINFRIQVDCTFNCQLLSSPLVKPPIFGKNKSSLLCHCYNPLTSAVLFNRILPLPSNEINPSEMFCHLHNGCSPAQLSAPRINDCFYTDDSIVISNEIVIGCNKKNTFLKCKRCLTTVGRSDSNSVKLWKCSINLPLDNYSHLGYLKYLVQKAVADPFSMFPKILLECEENQIYLLIDVIDKNLILSSCQNDLKLKNSQVVKLNYKLLSSFDSKIKVVEDDPFHCLHHVLVHKSMLDFSLEFLISAAEAIPYIFRAENEKVVYLNLNN